MKLIVMFLWCDHFSLGLFISEMESVDNHIIRHATLEVEELEFLAHKVVLAASSSR